MRKVGFIFKRPGSRYFWIGYSHQGKRYRESSKSTSEDFAEKLLLRRLSEIEETGTPTANFEKVTFEELADYLRTDYRVNNRRTPQRAEQSIAHLSTSFKGKKASRITTAMVREYIAKRLDDGAAPATVNRELSSLKRMFNLALQSETLSSKPYIPMLAESNTREGFLEYEQFQVLRDNLPDWLSLLATVAFVTGMRRGELTRLTWDNVTLTKGGESFIRLEASDTKNKRPRTVFLKGEALEAMKAAFSNRIADCDLVFHHSGKRIGETRREWSKACEAAGVKGLLFHDLRRSAVRNMVRAGVPERVAMRISGHQTRSVFDRYDITSEKDLKDAASLLNAHLESRKHHAEPEESPSG